MLRPLGCILGSALVTACGNPGEADEPCLEEVEDSMVIGDWDGDELLPLPDELTIEYGLQGGQHFFLDVELISGCEGPFEVALDFEDAASGEGVGFGDGRGKPRSCRMLIEDLRVVLLDDQERDGIVRASAEAGDCVLQTEVPEIHLRPR